MVHDVACSMFCPRLGLSNIPDRPMVISAQLILSVEYWKLNEQALHD
jgi:hypothetical protein